MRFTKVFGLAVIAAVTAMAFIGAGTASAQVHRVVLCKELITLCPTEKLWPTSTKLTALAFDPELTNSIGTILCEDSIVSAESAEEISGEKEGKALPLNFKNASATFGVLPTPSLGKGCVQACQSPPNSENVHVTLETLQLEVEAVDKYFLNGTGLALILNCPLVGTCVYRGENILVPIAHTGTHNHLKGVEKLALAKFSATLTRQTTHGGSAFCPATSLWLADYVLILAQSGANVGLAWPSLDK